MSNESRRRLAIVVAVCLMASSAGAMDWGLKTGSVELKSAGPLTFGPDHILFVGDPKAACIYAIHTGDRDRSTTDLSIDVTGIDGAVAKALGANGAIKIVDMVVNPGSGNIYLSVSTGPAGAALVRVDVSGKVSRVALGAVPHSKSILPDPPVDALVGEGRRRKNPRLLSITDLAYAENELFVTGLAGKKPASSVRQIFFPFVVEAVQSRLEVYHGAHGRYEDHAPIQAFLPFVIDGQPNLLAGFTCTPLVRFPVKQLAAKTKVRGTTVAELGNRNRPLGMITYRQGGKHFLLMANSARGVMKISTDDIGRDEGITERVGGGGIAGQSYETIDSYKGVLLLDKLNDAKAIVVTKGKADSIDLRTLPLP